MVQSPQLTTCGWERKYGIPWLIYFVCYIDCSAHVWTYTPIHPPASSHSELGNLWYKPWTQIDKVLQTIFIIDAHAPACIKFNMCYVSGQDDVYHMNTYTMVAQVKDQSVMPVLLLQNIIVRVMAADLAAGWGVCGTLSNLLVTATSYLHTCHGGLYGSSARPLQSTWTMRKGACQTITTVLCL